MRFSALSALALLFLGAVASQGVQMTIQEALLAQVSAQAFTFTPPFPDGTVPPSTVPPITAGTAPVTITGVAYSGSGCPHRTVQPSLDPTQQILTLTFLQYAIKLDQFTAYNSVKKSCRIYYTLRSPTGYSFTNVAYGISGTYFLSDDQVTYTARAALWLASDPAMKTFGSVTVLNIPGTTNSPVTPTPIPISVSPAGTTANPVQLMNPWWSICPPKNLGPLSLANMYERTAVVLDTSMTLQRLSTSSTGYVSVDDISGTFQKAMLVSWEDCTAVWDAEDGDPNF